MLNEVACAAIEKVFGEQITKLATGSHDVDLTITVVDNKNDAIINADIKGTVNKGEDYERLATVSVALYEFIAQYSTELGISDAVAIEKAALAMGKVVAKKLDGKTTTLSKKIKDKVDDIKDMFAETLPKTSVSGKTTIKVRSMFSQDKEAM